MNGEVNTGSLSEVSLQPNKEAAGIRALTDQVRGYFKEHQAMVGIRRDRSSNVLWEVLDITSQSAASLKMKRLHTSESQEERDITIEKTSGILRRILQFDDDTVGGLRIDSEGNIRSVLIHVTPVYDEHGQHIRNDFLQETKNMTESQAKELSEILQVATVNDLSSNQLATEGFLFS